MKTKTYQDFDLSIEKAGERYRARVLSSPDGTTPPTEFDLPFSDMQLENFILRFGQTRRTMRNVGVAGETVNRSLRDFGGGLYGAIFSGEIADRLHGSLGIVGQQESAGLRIRLRLSDAPELIDVPWEYLFDASAGRFLSLSVDTPVVRYLDMPGQVKPLAVKPPLRILVMLSSPAGYAELNVEQEWQKLKDAVADLERSGLVVLERMDKPTLSELQRRLRKQDIHIFHFIGHGGFDEAAQDGVLILETEDGKARPTSGKNLGTILHDEKSVQLAVLNACEGGRTSRQDPFAGVGQSLVQSGIPAVVAMQFEISDQAAITLAHEFYAALADGYPVDAALAEARKAIFAQDNIVEWGTPVLYMRAQDGRIFDIDLSNAQPVRPQVHTLTPVTAPPISPPQQSVTVETTESQEPLKPRNRSDGGAPGVMEAARRPVAEAPLKQERKSVPIGLDIGGWSAIGGIIAFFLPWTVLQSGSEITGWQWAKDGNTALWLCLLIFVGVLGLRITARFGASRRSSVPLIAAGAIAAMIVASVLDQQYESTDYYGRTVFVSIGSIGLGWSLAVLCAMAIRAGGLADLILKSDDQGTLLPFPRGHLVNIGGAAIGVVGMMFTGDLLIRSGGSAIAWTGVAVCAAAYLLALNAQRRGSPTVGEGWIGLVLSISVIGLVFAGYSYSNSTGVIIGFLAGVVLFFGGKVNHIDGQKGRQISKQNAQDT